MNSFECYFFIFSMLVWLKYIHKFKKDQRKYIVNRIIQQIVLISILAMTFSISANDGEGAFDRAKFYKTKISPDGKYLAVSMLLSDKIGLVFLDRKTLSPVGRVQFPGTHEVGHYQWVNDERVVINMLQRFPGKKHPQLSGELYGINFDGSMGEMIYGYQAGEMQTGSLIRARKSIQGIGEIIDLLPKDEKHILISSTPTVKRGNEYIVEEGLATVYKLNAYTGVIRNKVTKSPISHAKFLTNAEGEVKVVYGSDKNNINHLYIRKNNNWINVPKEKVGDEIKLLSIGTAGNNLYTLDKHNADSQGIFKLNLEDLNYSQVFTDRNVNLNDIEMSTNNRDAYAVKMQSVNPEYVILNNQLDEAKVFKKLLATFPNSEVTITSKADNGDFYVALVSSEAKTETLYLFNNKENKISVLFQLKAS